MSKGSASGWGSSHRGRVDWPCGPDCPLRKPGCQDHCPKMIIAQEKNAELRHKEHQAQIAAREYRQSVRQACKATKKY